ncbi:hypothetical protein [Actinocrispum wychmicini]|uniref:Uncharacterized protein n=1 Tax=Actinocrispum wychmicini TaxID=1213861 RepID=A0A4R2J4H2_9PSEU|nr:hypothetical protein [Actinocrispum wychmicini]TCO53064.1 hypothetical protein EV192_111261 [Actinocrispum wychmicini]
MISLSRLTRRLAETPADFLADDVSVPAVVSDVLMSAGGQALDARSAMPFESSERNWQRLVLISCWLVADDDLIAAADAKRLYDFLTEVLLPLADLVDAPKFVADPDRREELTRLALRSLSLLPDGETAAQAADRLATVDSVRRQEVLRAAKEAEERAAAVRKAMEEQRAREAAARYSQV